MGIWYTVGADTIADNKNVTKSIIFLNLPGFLFLISAFAHESILGTYEGILGRLTQNFYLSSMFIGTEISDLFRYGVCSFTGGMYTQKLFYSDIVIFLLLLGSFILGAITKSRKKY